MTVETTITAEARVMQDAELAAHRDILLDYEWDNQQEHLEWVATADKAEILSWVASVRQSEE